jgi:hypothetical protein
MPARYFWSAAFFKKYAPAVIAPDTRADAPPHHFSWAGDVADTGWYVHGYQSTWLPAALLAGDKQAALADALFNSTRHWTVGLHFNKGLAGAAQAEVDAARDTAMHPAVLDAFALAIISGGSGPQFPGMSSQIADQVLERSAAIGRATDALRQVVPNAGSYVSESDYFLKSWQQAFWGSNYARLARTKQRYDPEGLFVVHHGVGSEQWSDDGFTKLAT